MKNTKTSRFYTLQKEFNACTDPEAKELLRKKLIGYAISKADFSSKDFDGKTFVNELVLLGLKAREVEQIKAFTSVTKKRFLFSRKSVTAYIKDLELPEFVKSIMDIMKFDKIYDKLVEFGVWLTQNILFISETCHKIFNFHNLKIFYKDSSESICIGNCEKVMV